MEHTPQRVKALQGHPVVKLTCGASHSVVVTVSGSVWAWGSNAFGQLGLGDEPKKLRPTRVAGMLAGDAKATMWDDCDGRLTPVRLAPYARTCATGLNGKHAVDVSCGEAHTAVLTAEGRVFLFGKGCRQFPPCLASEPALIDYRCSRAGPTSCHRQVRDPTASSATTRTSL